MNTLVILQQTAQAGGNMSFLIMMVLIFAVMYFFMIRPQQKKQKELMKWRDSIQKGDKGISIDANVKIRVDKGSIVKDVTDIPVK